MSKFLNISMQLVLSCFFHPCAEILSQDLQAGAEDEQDYEAPKEGNLVYKLYSLQDLLLMVRSSVSLTHTRKVGDCENKVDSFVCGSFRISLLHLNS